MAVKLLGTPRSTCTQRALAALHEASVPYEFVFVNLATGEQKQPQFLSLQPFGVVPLLQDGDFSLYESRAIVRYVAEKYKDSGGASLYGETIEERALTEQWLEVESQNFNPIAHPIFYQLFVVPMRGLQADLSIIETNLPKFAKLLDIYDERLSHVPFLAGSFFSLADLSHLPLINYLISKPQVAELFQSRKHLMEWWSKISSRPSWKKVISFANP